MNITRLNSSGDIIIKQSSGGGNSGGGVVINNQNRSVEITENGRTTVVHDDGYTGLGNVDINVNVPPKNQDKVVDITENGTIEIFADTGFTGLGKITINTNVSAGTPQYENGVYIQHIDGRLFTTSKWTAGGYTNDDADGVAVITDEAKFLCHGAGVNYFTLKWLDPAIILYGITHTSDQALALQDFSGERNTKIMLDAGSPAAIAVNNYTTKSGKKGYLPSLGEWQIYQNKKTAIAEAASLIGWSAYNSEYSWSSTQVSETSAWAFGFKYGRTESNGKNQTSYRAYPFFPL